MSKTVGLVPGVCGVDETLTVALGTPVTYCYTVTNTGNVTLTSHTLVDDQLGTLIEDFPYTLAPGASAFLTVDNVLLNATTVNNATWTASSGAASVSACGGAITIPSSGNGTPYPSLANLAGAPASPATATVQISGLSHTWPDDIDMLLVGPGGQNLVMMPDTGGSTDIVGIDLSLVVGAPSGAIESRLGVHRGQSRLYVGPASSKAQSEEAGVEGLIRRFLPGSVPDRP